jgi:hypothetical protein
MRVQFTKRNDGGVVIQVFRANGSTTWRRYDKHAVFFSYHDLTHFAVETTLGFQWGFFGLIADGWDIADTEGKGPRGKPPLESILVEFIVGLFSGERVGGNPALTSEEFNKQLRQMAAPNNSPIGREFSVQELDATRECIRELHDRWAVLPTGATLELTFTFPLTSIRSTG